MKPATFLTADPDLEKISGQIITDPTTKTTINKEFGKKVFGNWLRTVPGENKTLTFSYHLPANYITWQNNRLHDWLNKLGFNQSEQGRYELMIQKQNQELLSQFYQGPYHRF